MSIKEATWEDTILIKQQFPHMTLDDKGPLQGRDIDEEPRRSVRVPKPNYKYEGYA